MPLCLLGFAVTTGCAHTERPWGRDATVAPGWRVFGEAAKEAIADPHTWIPLIAAGVFATGDLDEEVTEWAVRSDLMFDSTEAADEYSDDWIDAAKWLVYASALATPSGDEPYEWFYNKSKGLGATFAILEVGNQVASNAKDPFSRERPDGSNDNSFPSAHAIRASWRATMTARNIDAMPLHDYAKIWLKGSAYTFAGMTCLARLEANKHYPSDVLVGYSLGHFFAAFLNDAFITPISGDRMRFHAEAGQDSWLLGVQATFN